MSYKKKNNREHQLSFSKIYLPRMKSVYWKYFGFPSNDNNEIITKQKVVCTLCKAIITNHNNTTNIRAHIRSTHKAAFAELIATHGIKIPARKTQSKSKQSMLDDKTPQQDKEHSSSIKKDQTLYSSTEALNEYESFHMIDSIPLSSEESDQKESNYGDESSMITLDEDATNEIVLPKKHMDVKEARSLNVEINPLHIPIEYDVKDILQRLIVNDLVNMSHVYDSGMQELVSCLLNNHNLPARDKLENSLKQLHCEKFGKLRENLRSWSHTKPYSIGFDVWKNIESKQYISIFFNYIPNPSESRICHELFLTTELHKYTMLDQVFDGFNLDNCSAAILNCNNQTINTFLSQADVPSIFCFSHIINTCVSDVFDLSDVSSVFEEVEALIAHYSPDINSEDLDLISATQEFPISKIYVLRFFCENVSWPDELDWIISKAKHIVEAVSPLEMTLETLKEEDVPLSSLFIPFAEKIIEKYFTIQESDDDLLQRIKITITKNLKERIASNHHLTVASILDPRFHKYIPLENNETYLNILNKKRILLKKQQRFPSENGNVKACNSKKSHLKVFFDDFESTTAQETQIEEIVKNDLKRYRECAFATLDESPLLWWNEKGGIYGPLKQIAEAYNCIIGYRNMNLKMSFKQQIRFNRKRFSLTGKLVDVILFLNSSN